MKSSKLELGAVKRPDGSTSFVIWAPKSETVELQLVSPEERTVAMERDSRGYWRVEVTDVTTGSRYFFRHNGATDWPDPASRSQPDGVHGASEVFDPATLSWMEKTWSAPAIEDYVIYEVHTGTFTESGTFDAAVDQLDRLVDLGVTAVEIMPVAEFPGGRNWGYDGVFPFAAQSSYGGPAGLARLVDACHERCLAVVLDVVYNHFGPEGAYQGAIGNYFTDKYRTPWGAAVNFDGPDSAEVRRYFVESARYWLRDLHIDAFRLDAVHAIFDQSAYPFLRQFTDDIHREARRLGRTVYLIAESDLNDPRMIQPSELGGYGFDAQWSDDLHHALHARLTGERTGYYLDFGSVSDVKRALEHGYVYAGQYSESRMRPHGAAPHGIPPARFVVCSQNHDQVGNRASGDRLTTSLDIDQLKLAAATVVLSPFTPMLFMGEEYGESAPFQYFTSHNDSELIEGVRRGRTEEFKSFAWSGEVPDPQAEETFVRSKLDFALRGCPKGSELEGFYRQIIRLRREVGLQHDSSYSTRDVEFVGPKESIISLWRRNDAEESVLLLNFGEDDEAHLPGTDVRWRLLLNSAEPRIDLGSDSISNPTYSSGDSVAVIRCAAMFFVRD
ncbi:MAG: malto-oligosyltrehalose trehalohydrolase [Nitrolancea sp.]